MTDVVKGRRQYWLRFATGREVLASAGLKMVTVCQVNPSILPRLKDNGTQVTFAASDDALVSAGPGIAQARPHIVSGGFDTAQVTLQLAAPREAEATAIHAAAHVRSSNPPSQDVAYRIEYSADGGSSWQPLVDNWRITRCGVEPADFWSQSFCWGEKVLKTPQAGPVQVRFSNTGKKAYARAELHLIYRLPQRDATQVSYAWTDATGPHTHSHTIPAGDNPPHVFTVPTAATVRTRWVHLRPIPR